MLFTRSKSGLELPLFTGNAEAGGGPGGCLGAGTPLLGCWIGLCPGGPESAGPLGTPETPTAGGRDAIPLSLGAPNGFIVPGGPPALRVIAPRPPRTLGPVLLTGRLGSAGGAFLAVWSCDFLPFFF